MESLTEIFRMLLRMSLLALPVMAVVLAARWLLARAMAPKRAAYALWAVVGFRLLVPPGLLSAMPWSIFNLSVLRPVAQITGTVGSVTAGHVTAGTVLGTYSAPALSQIAPQLGVGAAAAQSLVRPAPVEIAVRVAAVVWLAGLAAAAVYSAVSYLRLRRHLACAVLRERGVYESEAVPTPFVLGWLRPKIYIPFHLDDGQRAYVLCHERTHLRRHDPWWKLLAYALCAVYWWNPSVWVCYLLFCRDMEMSCDEAVLRELGPEVKRAYSLSLVSFAAGRHFPAAAPLAFGECGAKSRVKNVLRWKQASSRMAFLAAAAVLAVVAVCCSNARESGCRVKLSGAQSAMGVTYRCHFPEPVQTWAVFEDVYEGGELLSSTLRISGGVGDNRDFTRTLSCSSPAAAYGSFSGPLTCTSGMEGAEPFVWQIDLPKASYTGWGAVTGDDAAEPGRRQRDTFTLPDEGEMTLLTVIGSTEKNGGITSYNRYGGVEAVNDTVVRFRLAVSAGDVSALRRAHTASGVSALAQTLYGLRTPYVGDAYADGQLLLALNTAQWGDYKTELFTAAEPYVLQINFTADPGAESCDALDASMRQKALVLLALIDNLDTVRWTYPKRTDFAGQNTGEGFLDRAAADTLAAALGYADVRAAGQSAAGVEALLNDEAAGTSLVPMAAALYGRKVSSAADLAAVKTLLSALGADELGAYSLTAPASGSGGRQLYVDFQAAGAVDRAGWLCARDSYVLLALVGDLDGVTWRNPEQAGSTTAYALTSAGIADRVLAQAGLPDSRACGASEQSFTTLLVWLDGQRLAAEAGTVTGETPTGSVPYPASGGQVTQFSYDLPDTAKTFALECVTYHGGLRTADRWPEVREFGQVSSSGAGPLARQGRLYLSYYPRRAAGGWDQAEFALLPWAGGDALCRWSAAIPAPPAGQSYGREETSITGTRDVSENSSTVLFAACFGADGNAAPLAAAQLNDAAALADAVAQNDVVIVVRLSLSDRTDVTTAESGTEPFTDLLGFDGLRADAYTSYGWSDRIYYARGADDALTPIAESYGGEVRDYRADLDGDGEEELVCCCVGEGDGHESVLVYRRAGEQIQVGHPDLTDLPGHDDWGANSTQEKYDPETKTIRVEYTADAKSGKTAVREYRGLAGLSFEPYVPQR